MQLTDSDIKTLLHIRQVIESSIHLRITIAELALLAAMSASKLTRAFKYLFQISISRYHLVIQMEYALALLEDGLMVKKVAILLGYRSPEHFSRAFKKIFNQSPRNIRMKK